MKPARVLLPGKDAIVQLLRALAMTPDELAEKLGISEEEYKQLEDPQVQKMRISPKVLVAMYDMGEATLGEEHDAVKHFREQFPLAAFRQSIAVQPGAKENIWLKVIKGKWEKGITLDSPDFLLSALLMAANVSLSECTKELGLPELHQYSAGVIINHAHQLLAEPVAFVETLFARASENTQGWFDNEKRDAFLTLMRNTSQSLEQKPAAHSKRLLRTKPRINTMVIG